MGKLQAFICSENTFVNDELGALRSMERSCRIVRAPCRIPRGARASDAVSLFLGQSAPVCTTTTVVCVSFFKISVHTDPADVRSPLRYYSTVYTVRDFMRGAKTGSAR